MDTKEKAKATGQRRRSATAADTRRRTDGASRSARPANTRAGGIGTQTKRRQAAEAAKNRTQRDAPVKKPTPDVVYTQPVPFNKYHFLIRIATVVAVVFALLFGMSIFFKVETVTVAGNKIYTAWDVRQASGIQEGENLLTLSEPRISSNIKAKLPYVDSVRVGIKLPNTVKIEVVELDVVYAIEADNGDWWIMSSDGVLIEKTNSAEAQQHTRIPGVVITKPAVGQQAVALQREHTTEDGQTLPITVLASEQLQIAISIAQSLEENGVLGEVVSIDVTDPGNLELWYGQRYQVLLGDSSDLGYKIKRMKLAIDDEEMGEHQTGILDVSYSNKSDPVICTPFP